MTNALRYLSLAALMVAAGSQPGRCADPVPTPKPELRLRVSTHSGVIPLALTLKGELIDVDGAAYAKCLVRVEWTHKTPGGFEFNSVDEFPCAKDESSDPLPSSFEKTVSLGEPGTYSYRIVLEPVEGRRLAGTTQDVRVFRSPFELGVTADKSE